MYEIIDAVMPITFLGPLFINDWLIVVGFMNIFIRLGSVTNFLLSPIIYRMFGIKVAFWIAAIIGCTGLPLFFVASVARNNISSDPNSTQSNTQAEYAKVSSELEAEMEIEMTNTKQNEIEPVESVDIGILFALSTLY